MNEPKCPIQGLCSSSELCASLEQTINRDNTRSEHLMRVFPEPIARAVNDAGFCYEQIILNLQEVANSVTDHIVADEAHNLAVETEDTRRYMPPAQQ
jgi:hypothetical protein